MNEFDIIVYKVLLCSLPLILTIIGFFLAMAVKALFKMAKDISCIKTTMQIEAAKREALEERVDIHEGRLDKLFERMIP